MAAKAAHTKQIAQLRANIAKLRAAGPPSKKPPPKRKPS